MRYYFLFIISFLLQNLLPGQEWKPLSMNGGGYVTQLISHPTNQNTWAATVDIGHAYITHDNGENWSPLYAKMPKTKIDNFGTRGFAFHPSNSLKMYFTTGRGKGAANSNIWTSLDGGLTFLGMVLPINIDGNDVGRWGGCTLLVRRTNNIDTTIIAGQARANTSGVLIGEGGIAIRSTNTGTITKLATTFFDNANITKIAFSKTNNMEIYVSTIDTTRNGGTAATQNQGLHKINLQTLAITSYVTNHAVYDFDFDAANPNLIVFTSNNGFYKIDASDVVPSITALSFPSLPNSNITSYSKFVTCHPTISNKWFFGSYKFDASIIFHTLDGGSTFDQVRYRSNQVNGLNKLDYTASYVANNKRFNFGNEMAGIVFCNANPNRAMISDYSSTWVTEDAGLAFTNGNTNIDQNANWKWRMACKGIYVLAGMRISHKGAFANTFYNHVADFSHYESSNEGYNTIYNNTAANVSPSFMFMNMTTRCVWDTLNQKLYLAGCKQHGDGGRFVTSTDSGITFSEPNNISSNINFLYQNTDVVTDMQLVGSSIIIGVKKKSTSTIHHVLKSNDGGATWVDWAQGLPSPNSTGWPFRLWEEIDHLLLDANGQTLYLYYDQQLWRRGINELSWTQISLPVASNIKFAQTLRSTSNAIVLSFNNGSLYKLTNASTTPIWQLLAGPSIALERFSVNSKDHIIGFTTTDGITEQKIYFSERAISNQDVSWKELTQVGLWGMLASLTFINENTVIAQTKSTGSFRISLLNCNNTLSSISSSVQGTTYQWQQNAGAGFQNIGNSLYHSGTNTKTLNLSVPPTSFNGYHYRCIVDGLVGTSTPLSFNVNWNGSLSTAWETKSNWSCLMPADEHTNVLIDGANLIHQPTLQSVATIKSLTTLNGGNLIIKPTGKLVIKK